MCPVPAILNILVQLYKRSFALSNWMFTSDKINPVWDEKQVFKEMNYAF
jgi:hypothetical protein